MNIDPKSPVIVGLYNTEDDTLEEQALWSTLRIRLQQQDADDGIMYLRHLLSCEQVSEITEMQYTRHKYKIYQNTSTYDAKYNITTKQKTGFMFSALMEGSKRTLTQEHCMNIAIQEAQLPGDARQVLSEFQAIGEEEVFIARWHHYHEGVWVEGDYIQTMVNAATGKVFGYQRHWHDINSKLSER